MIIKDKQKIINKRKLNKNSPSKYDHLGHFFIISSFTNWNIKETVNVLSIFLMTVKNLCYFSPDIFLTNFYYDPVKRETLKVLNILVKKEKYKEITWKI